ncbi:hypothetical protein BD309DRAFT_78018 [Dichomitus squalens]|nr:hypothetical protein BD309DRAFT_78018 [Dichomitus squalens]
MREVLGSLAARPPPSEVQRIVCSCAFLVPLVSWGGRGHVALQATQRPRERGKVIELESILGSRDPSRSRTGLLGSHVEARSGDGVGRSRARTPSPDGTTQREGVPASASLRTPVIICSVAPSVGDDEDGRATDTAPGRKVVRWDWIGDASICRPGQLKARSPFPLFVLVPLRPMSARGRELTGIQVLCFLPLRLPWRETRLPILRDESRNATSKHRTPQCGQAHKLQTPARSRT